MKSQIICVLLAGAVAQAASAVGYTAFDYKGRDAITMQWDGIDNQGTGSHVSDAETWRELVKGVDISVYLESANFSAADNALTCVSRTAGAAATGSGTKLKGRSTYVTVETVFEPAVGPGSGDMMLWYNGSPYGDGRSFYLRSSGRVACKTFPSALGANNAWSEGAHNVTAVYGTTAFLDFILTDGEEKALTSANENLLDCCEGSVYIGACARNVTGMKTPETAVNPFVGKIHALRFYTRRLTKEEVRWNAHLDEARFDYGGNLHVLGFPEEYGTPSPAYGSSDASGDTVTVSPGDLTAYDDGAMGVAVSDGVRMCCLGYVLNGTGPTNAVPTAPIARADGMTVAWIWQKQVRVTAVGTDECPTVSVNGESGARVVKWIGEGATATISSAFAGGTRVVAAWRGAPAGSRLTDGKLIVAATAACEVSPWMAERASLRFWRGTESTSANAAANWVDADGNTGLPAEGATIVLDGNETRNLFWNLNDVTLGNWIQCGFARTVTFQTGPGGTASGAAKAAYGVFDDGDGNRYLEVTGDVLLAGGTWTHTAQPSFASTDEALCNGNGVWRIAVHAGGDIEVGADATVTADNCGFTSKQAPTPYISSGLVGNTHAGRGGSSSQAGQNSCPHCWGTPYRPISQGGGAGTSQGGGAIELRAGGALVVDGLVTATAKSETYYTAAGGSIWLTGASLSGAGVICADGGLATSGAGGGGGRIAVCLTGEGRDFSSFSGTMTASPGAYSSYGAAAGTIYRETADCVGNGELTVKGLGKLPDRLMATELVDIGRDYTFSKVSILNGARLSVMSNVVLRVGELVTDSKSLSSLTLAGGTAYVPEDFEVADLNLTVLASGSQLRFGAEGDLGLLTVRPSGDFVCDAPFTLGGLLVAEGATMGCTKNYNDGWLSSGGLDRYVKADLVVTGDVTVASGAKMDVNAAGYKQDVGPGAQTGCAGSYGGLAQGADESRCYGSLIRPDDLGSGAGADVGSPGGGALRVVCGGTFTLDGQIDTGTIDFVNGRVGGSGGSVWIEAQELVGSGSVSADGGKASLGVGRGGGGRIALHLTKDGATFDSFFASGGSVHAFGGTTIGQKVPLAGAGTVYYATVSDGMTNGTVVVDGGYASVSGLYAGIPAPVDGDAAEDFRNVTLVVRNGGGVSFSSDIRFAEIEYPAVNVSVKLNDHTIKVSSMKHRRQRGWVARAVEDLGEHGLGRYEIAEPGLMILVK